MKRADVYKLIDGERDYQDSQRKDGTYESRTMTAAEEILMIEEYAQRARVAWTSNHGDLAGLDFVRKIAGLAVRCMENHETPARKI